MRPGRITAAALVFSAFMVLLAPPLFAQEDVGEVETGTTTTISEPSGLVPAVEFTDEEAVEAETDWTYRYLVPTALLLAVLVALLTSIRYFTNVVRKRYRIVEE